MMRLIGHLAAASLVPWISHSRPLAAVVGGGLGLLLGGVVSRSVLRALGGPTSDERR
jgi:hypothetical protein